MADRRIDPDRSNGMWRRGLSLQRLMVSVALISAGLGLYMAGVAHNPYGGFVTIFAVFTSGALIGAGVFTPFHETEMGAFIGVAVTALLIVIRIVGVF